MFNSITLSLYDSCSVGVTWNTDREPTAPCVQVFDGADCREYSANAEKLSSFEYPHKQIEFYVVKAAITDLLAGKEYSYRCCDGENVSEFFTFKVPKPDSREFDFVHISDSQVDIFPDPTGSGKCFSKTLGAMSQAPHFILHTGDMVEWSKFESYWSEMLNVNREHFTKIPIAAISGNHETTYKNGSFETYKHFHYSMPDQDTSMGFYYFFDYGPARFIMLNTNRLCEDRLTDDQYAWLLELFENNPKKWTVVAMHNPMYSIGKYGVNPERNGVCRALKGQLEELFIKHGVDIVLQAHDHTYSKTYPIGYGGADKEYAFEIIDGVKYAINPKGVIYVMHGPGGDQVRAYDEIDPEIYEYADVGKPNSWAEISISGELLSIRVYGLSNGEKILWRNYGIKKQ